MDKRAQNVHKRWACAMSAGAIDLTPYTYRSNILRSADGIQEVELGLPVLAHATPSGRDWRIVAGAHQVPYVVERKGILRTFAPSARDLGYDSESRIDRWELILPYPNLPLSSLSVMVAERIFKRSVQIYEVREDRRGERKRRVLGHSLWTRTPDQKPAPLLIPLRARPQSTRLILEVEHGDNAPLRLNTFQLHYSAPRLIFKGSAREDLWLYYGDPKATTPQYDIALVADALLSAERVAATLDEEERLKSAPSRFFFTLSGSSRLIFWLSLGTAAAILLFVIKKLLPAQTEKQ